MLTKSHGVDRGRHLCVSIFVLLSECDDVAFAVAVGTRIATTGFCVWQVYAYVDGGIYIHLHLPRVSTCHVMQIPIPGKTCPTRASIQGQTPVAIAIARIVCFTSSATANILQCQQIRLRLKFISFSAVQRPIDGADVSHRGTLRWRCRSGVLVAAAAAAIVGLGFLTDVPCTLYSTL
jgi:hypothetical protein